MNKASGNMAWLHQLANQNDEFLSISKLNKIDWLHGLEHFLQIQRKNTPVPSVESLSDEQDWQRRVIGGDLISWARKHSSFVLEQRASLGFLDLDPEPVVVFTTSIPGLIAADDILGQAKHQWFYMLDTEYQQWLNQGTFDNYRFHIHLHSQFVSIEPEILLMSQKQFPKVPSDQLRTHFTGCLWGKNCGVNATHLWVWNHQETKLLEEAFVHGYY